MTQDTKESIPVFILMLLDLSAIIIALCNHGNNIVQIICIGFIVIQLLIGGILAALMIINAML